MSHVKPQHKRPTHKNKSILKKHSKQGWDSCGASCPFPETPPQRQHSTHSTDKHGALGTSTGCPEAHISTGCTDSQRNLGHLLGGGQWARSLQTTYLWHKLLPETQTPSQTDRKENPHSHPQTEVVLCYMQMPPHLSWLSG